MLFHKLIGTGPDLYSASYVTSTSQDRATSTSATFTFSAVSTGVADGDRVLIVAVFAYRNPGEGSLGSMSNFTVGGSNATLLGSITTGGDCKVYLYSIAVATGTTTTITVSTGFANSCGIAVYRLLSKRKAVTATVATASATSGTSISTSVNTSIGAFVLGVIGSTNDAMKTWTGVTEDFERDIRSTEYFTAGSKFPAGVNGSLTVSATRSGSGTYLILSSLV